MIHTLWHSQMVTTLFSTRKSYKLNKFERYEDHEVINFNVLQYQLHYYGMQSWKIPYPWRLVHLRKKYVPVKILWFASPHGKGPFQTNFPPPPTLIPCQESPITCQAWFPPHLLLTASIKSFSFTTHEANRVIFTFILESLWCGKCDAETDFKVRSIP